MAREDKETKRTEFLLFHRYAEDRDVIEWLERQTNKSDAIRNVLIDHVRGSRYAEQQRRIAGLEHELELMRRVVDRLSSG